MKDNERVWFWGIIGFLIGVALTFLFATSAVSTNNIGMIRMMGMRTNQMMDERHEEDQNSNNTMIMQMKDMTSSLKDKKGDTFDKAFLSEMIEHHKGAIEMAKLAKDNAKRQEIKSLAEEIINTQTKEINQMKSWLQSWQ